MQSVIQKKGEATERRDSIGKSRKIYFLGEGGGGVAFENPMGYSMYKGRMEIFGYISVNIERLPECTLSAQSRSAVKKRKKRNVVLSICARD